MKVIPVAKKQKKQLSAEEKIIIYNMLNQLRETNKVFVLG